MDPTASSCFLLLCNSSDSDDLRAGKLGSFLVKHRLLRPVSGGRREALALLRKGPLIQISNLLCVYAGKISGPAFSHHKSPVGRHRAHTQLLICLGTTGGMQRSQGGRRGGSTDPLALSCACDEGCLAPEHLHVCCWEDFSL